jgi:hypothetical protein
MSQIEQLKWKKDRMKDGAHGPSGVVRIVDAMRLHSRSIEILDSGCMAISCLAKAEPSLKPLIRRADAIPIILKGMQSFASSASFCAQASAALWCLAFKDSHNKTVIGGLGGIELVITAMGAHETEAMVEHGNIAIANTAANHKPNRVLAGQAGAVKAVLKTLESKQDDVVLEIQLLKRPKACYTGCNALIALCQGEQANQLRLLRQKGAITIEAICKAHKDQPGISKLSQHLLQMLATASKELQGKAIVSHAYGQDAHALLSRPKASEFGEQLMASKRPRQVRAPITPSKGACANSLPQSRAAVQVVRQEIIKFSAAGKDPKAIKKWRLVSLDSFDLTVYGGNDDTSDDVFTRVITNYPTAKMMGCKAGCTRYSLIHATCARPCNPAASARCCRTSRRRLSSIASTATPGPSSARARTRPGTGWLVRRGLSRARMLLWD